MSKEPLEFLLKDDKLYVFINPQPLCSLMLIATLKAIQIQILSNINFNVTNLRTKNKNYVLFVNFVYFMNMHYACIFVNTKEGERYVGLSNPVPS